MSTNAIEAAARALREADAILVGASNGFSISEGYHLFASNEAFYALHGDFARRYGIRSLLEGFCFPYPQPEARWAFIARTAQHYSLNYHGSPLMDALRRVTADRPHFLVTSNGEGHFTLGGYAPENVLELEGSLLHMQCSRPCHRTVYPAADLLRRMAQAEQNGLVPTELLPTCPHCGAPMVTHAAIHNAFLPDTDGQKRLSDFLARWHGQRLAILELGIGARNQRIKAPLMRLTAAEPQAVYITCNKGELYIPAAIAPKAIGIDGDLCAVLPAIAQAMARG